MGGRGSSSGLSRGGRNSVIDPKAKIRTIETEYKKAEDLEVGITKMKCWKP